AVEARALVAVVAHDEDVARRDPDRPLRRARGRAARGERRVLFARLALDPDAPRPRVPDVEFAAAAPALEALLPEAARQRRAVHVHGAIDDLHGLARQADDPADGRAPVDPLDEQDLAARRDAAAEAVGQLEDPDRVAGKEAGRHLAGVEAHGLAHEGAEEDGC